MGHFHAELATRKCRRLEKSLTRPAGAFRLSEAAFTLDESASVLDLVRCEGGSPGGQKIIDLRGSMTDSGQA